MSTKEVMKLLKSGKSGNRQKFKLFRNQVIKNLYSDGEAESSPVRDYGTCLYKAGETPERLRVKKDRGVVF